MYKAKRKLGQRLICVADHCRQQWCPWPLLPAKPALAVLQCARRFPWGLSLAPSCPYSRMVLFITLFFFNFRVCWVWGWGGYFSVFVLLFCFTQTFWVSNQLSEFPIGRLITSYWLIRTTFLPLGNGTFLSLWLLCLHTFCYLMSTLANE